MIAPGTQLGPYRVLSALGAGGMGEVYRAFDQRLSREVAVKVLPESLEANPEALARFEREARAVAALSHPNILGIFDVGTDSGHAYAVTELLKGETLRERLARQASLPPEELRDLAAQILRGLGAAHECGIVHRDIKPENLFITEDGRVKILDFGVARITGAAAADEDDATVEHFRTSTGVVLGTIAYMAPEQLSGARVDQRADIFSFGCVLYEMAAGHRPFGADTPMATAAKILGERPSLHDVPAPLRPVIARCLEKDLSARFASAAAVEQALRPQPSWWAIRNPYAAVAGALVLALFVAAGAFLWNRSRSGGGQRVGAETETAAEITSVAVLPFVNVGGNPTDEYLSDGLTDELINVLGRVEGLHIPGRTSSFDFKGRRFALAEVASKLKVQHAIEGSVQRSGERLRIRAQLVTVPDGYQVWSQSYDEVLSDLLGVQNRIANSIVGSLRKQSGASVQPVPTPNTADPEAYRLYLRGRHLADRWTRENFDAAQAAYREAIDRDPNYAPAYAALADLYSMLDHRPALTDTVGPQEGYRLGVTFAQKALALDPRSADAHSALGHIYVHTGNFADAERHLSEAIRLNPNSAEANLWYALLTQMVGRPEEARRLRSKALELDPLSVQANTVMMAAAWRTGDFEEALTIGRRALAASPDSGELWFQEAMSFAYSGRLQEATEALSRAESTPKPPQRQVDEMKTRILSLQGRQAEARLLLQQIEKDPARFPGAVPLMRGWATVGDLERALFWMREAVTNSPEYSRVNLMLPPHPAFAQIRSHPEYVDALRRLGLTQYGPP